MTRGEPLAGSPPVELASSSLFGDPRSGPFTLVPRQDMGTG